MFALVMMLVLLVFFFGQAQVQRNAQSVVISLPAMPAPNHIEVESGLRFVKLSGSEWPQTSLGSARLFVEASVAEHYALSHGPGRAAEMVLAGDLPECPPATEQERIAWAELASVGTEPASVGVMVVVTRAESELLCATL